MPNLQAEGLPPCRLSTTAYSIYSQLPSVNGELPSIHNLRMLDVLFYCHLRPGTLYNLKDVCITKLGYGLNTKT